MDRLCRILLIQQEWPNWLALTTSVLTWFCAWSFLCCRLRHLQLATGNLPVFAHYYCLWWLLEQWFCPTFWQQLFNEPGSLGLSSFCCSSGVLRLPGYLARLLILYCFIHGGSLALLLLLFACECQRCDGPKAQPPSNGGAGLVRDGFGALPAILITFGDWLLHLSFSVVLAPSGLSGTWDGHAPLLQRIFQKSRLPESTRTIPAIQQIRLIPFIW